MEAFLYAIIFITGTFFGSFFTLAVYRIPKNEDILIKHSYCPNCNHKLGFFDLFPVLSYIFLGGKCRYCKNKIRPRYLILELLSGFAFVILAISMKMDISNMNSIINIALLLIYISVLFIIAGIDKENIKIEKTVLFFGFAIEVLYIIYKCTLGIFNVYPYVMYLLLFIILLIILKISKKTNGKQYLENSLYLSLYMILYGGIKIYIFTAILSLIINLFYKKILKKNETKTPIGFYLSVSNILVIVISNIIMNYV